MTNMTSYHIKELQAMINTANYTISNPLQTTLQMTDLKYATHYQYVLITLYDNTTELGEDVVHFVTKYEHWNIWDKIAVEAAGLILFWWLVTILIKCHCDPTRNYEKVKRDIVRMKIREREHKKQMNLKKKHNKILPV